MPAELIGPDFPFLPREELLTFEEILRSVEIFVALGVTKVRITGGEPLLRKGVEELIGMLSKVPGVKDLTMTTNALLLPDRARSLRAAGLQRVTVSLDALDESVFQAMVDRPVPVSSVLQGIVAAEEAGLLPIKVNMVVKRGANQDQIERMAEHFRGTGHVLRFIEYMDVGTSNGWRVDEVVPAKEILDRIHTRWPIEPVAPNYLGEVANRYRYLDGAGEIGIIASVTHPFCGDCNRARLTANGEFFTCLFASKGFDLRALLREGGDDEAIGTQIREVWEGRSDRYSEIRGEATRRLPRVEMSRIGG
jgi:cyclic pyranopterin phosphate synthase